MHPLLRLFTLWLFALALPIQGAAAMTARDGAPVPAREASQAMSMMSRAATASGLPMSDSAAPALRADGGVPAHAAPCCPHCPHPAAAADKAGCGCPAGGLQAVAALPALVVAPLAARMARGARPAPVVPVALFLTGGPDRPPRPVRA